MKTLVMDTAWKNLVIALFEDGNLVEGLSKKHSRNRAKACWQNWKFCSEKPAGA